MIACTSHKRNYWPTTPSPMAWLKTVFSKSKDWSRNFVRQKKGSWGRCVAKMLFKYGICSVLPSQNKDLLNLENMNRIRQQTHMMGRYGGQRGQEVPICRWETWWGTRPAKVIRMEKWLLQDGMPVENLSGILFKVDAGDIVLRNVRHIKVQQSWAN